MSEGEEQLTAPFPYFGGKRAVVELVWPRFGQVANYIEPFCGSLAMLLGAPQASRTETINDASGLVVNFWRAVQADPQAVAGWADWPVSEIDLEARHGWLVNRAERLGWSLQDPDFHDAKIAGWWVWGACAWIGGGWCSGTGPWLSNGAQIANGRERDAGQGINRKLPHVGDAGRGINRQLPHVGHRHQFILEWFSRLSRRLRDVRIVCGDWSRVLTPVVTTGLGTTAVFLDPPYCSDGISRGLYEHESALSPAVGQWCLENGPNPDLRIVVCGYAGEYDLPGWEVIAGRATNGGYGNAAANQNSKRETMWVSPHCAGDPAPALALEFQPMD